MMSELVGGEETRLVLAARHAAARPTPRLPSALRCPLQHTYYTNARVPSSLRACTEACGEPVHCRGVLLGRCCARARMRMGVARRSRLALHSLVLGARLTRAVCCLCVARPSRRGAPRLMMRTISRAFTAPSRSDSLVSILQLGLTRLDIAGAIRDSRCLVQLCIFGRARRGGMVAPTVVVDNNIDSTD